MARYSVSVIIESSGNKAPGRIMEAFIARQIRKKVESLDPDRLDDVTIATVTVKKKGIK